MCRYNPTSTLKSMRWCFLICMVTTFLLYAFMVFFLWHYPVTFPLSMRASNEALGSPPTLQEHCNVQNIPSPGSVFQLPIRRELTQHWNAAIVAAPSIH